MRIPRLSRAPRRLRRTHAKLRWGAVLLALALPGVWLAEGCGARSDVEEAEGSSGSGSGGMTTDARPDMPGDALPDAPADAPVDVPLDVPADVPMDVLLDVPIDVPMDVPADIPLDVPVDVPTDVPADVPADISLDVPADVPADGACPDSDGDGYTTCDNDCDDTNALVNPGAFDFPNGIDDDCDGGVDNPVLDCSTGLQYTSQEPVDYAKALDICQTTTAGAAGASKKWGLISAELRLASGAGVPASQAHAIVPSFGSVILPRKNANFVFFSSGLAGTPGQPYWAPGTPQGGTDFQVPAVPVPPGFPTNKQGCPLPSDTLAHDSVNLKLSIRVPTNAKSFAFDHSFFSSEYPEYACSAFNDLWVTLLDSSLPPGTIANNRDIIFDNQGTPGSVNLNFFDRCVAGPTGCAGGVPGFNFCAGGKGELNNTGYGDLDAPCNGTPSSIGGGTGWISTESPMVPGETITLQFIVWDSSDGIYDSSAIFDNFRWQTGPLTFPKTQR